MTKVSRWKSFISLAVAVLLPFATTFLPAPPRNDFHSLFLSSAAPPASNTTVSDHLRRLTARPHVSGSPADALVARYVSDVLSSAALPTHSVRYDVLLTFPSFRSLTLSSPELRLPVALPLTQLHVPGHPSPFSDEVVPTFHAYAPSGSAVGPAVYANYGRREDFSALARLGINVSRSVVVARYGKIHRGDIVKNAHHAGAAGVVIYTDTADYGSESDGWFPESRWMPPSGVQVGTVYNGAGDPTTPGWASTLEMAGGCERAGPPEGAVADIPSLPISAADAAIILKEIGGPVADEAWHGLLDVPVYRLGPGPAVLNLTYIAKESITTIENVFALIRGTEEPDRYVILGNHRDAWTYGAVDPNSGTATLLEISGRLEKLMKRGWKPRRSIILCNWDAEEYGLIGSTEWVEENREVLRSKAIAYLNVDIAVAGPGFHAYATPQLDDILKQVTQQVEDPDNSSRTVYDAWIDSGDTPLIGRLGGGGSDYAPFVQHVGVPAVDMFFGGGYPVYHSIYDDYQWMEKFGDPMFRRHVAAASIWGLLALRLADDKILPFNYLSYATELQSSAKELEAGEIDKSVSFVPLYESIEKLRKSAVEINKQKEFARDAWFSKWTKTQTLPVRDLNDRMMMAERAFTDADGLFKGPWYKHLIYGPSKQDDYGSKSFPGIDDAIEEAKNANSLDPWKHVQHEIWRAARAITQASLVLSGEFT
ncbi:probable glutamate carboxypeptidase LAMP1 [Nymphaea colorata]|nr:probable glutamate carboxypeptidase LAMP1 [Nymphaea colorata]